MRNASKHQRRSHPAFRASNIRALPIDALKPHEEVKGGKSRQYNRFASKVGARLRIQPIIIDEQTHVILDGHHRWMMCKEMGCKSVPVIAIDYLNDPRIHVVPRRTGETITKRDVLKMGVSGQVYPAKSTKHVFLPDKRALWVPLKKYMEKAHDEEEK